MEKRGEFGLTNEQMIDIVKMKSVLDDIIDSYIRSSCKTKDNKILNEQFEDAAPMNSQIKNDDSEAAVREFMDSQYYKKTLSANKPLIILYKEYETRCLHLGLYCYSAITFAKRLKDLGYTSIRKAKGRYINASRHKF